MKEEHEYQSGDHAIYEEEGGIFDVTIMKNMSDSVYIRYNLRVNKIIQKFHSKMLRNPGPEEEFEFSRKHDIPAGYYGLGKLVEKPELERVNLN